MLDTTLTTYGTTAVSRDCSRQALLNLRLNRQLPWLIAHKMVPTTTAINKDRNTIERDVARAMHDGTDSHGLALAGTRRFGSKFDVSRDSVMRTAGNGNQLV